MSERLQVCTIRTANDIKSNVRAPYCRETCIKIGDGFVRLCAEFVCVCCCYIGEEDGGFYSISNVLVLRACGHVYLWPYSYYGMIAGEVMYVTIFML